MHGFGGSREGSPEWYPACFRFDPTTEARARQHLLGDDGLAPYMSLLGCRSFNVLYQGCFRRRKVLESARRLREYLLALCWHPSEYKTPNTMRWLSSRWQRCHLKKVFLAARSILHKQVSFPCQKIRMCYLIRSGHGMREELLPWRKTSYCKCHE